MPRPPDGTSAPLPTPAGDDGSRRVRDDFAFPALDHAQIDVLKRRAQKLGTAAKKNELMRAGIAELAGLSDEQLLDAVRPATIKPCSLYDMAVTSPKGLRDESQCP